MVRWKQKRGDSRQGRLVLAQLCAPVSSGYLPGPISKNNRLLLKKMKFKYFYFILFSFLSINTVSVLGKVKTKNLNRLSGLFESPSWVSVCWWGHKGISHPEWMAIHQADLWYFFSLFPSPWLIVTQLYMDINCTKQHQLWSSALHCTAAFHTWGLCLPRPRWL